MRFEGEEVRAIALGSCWVAAITSLNFLRIFTEGGLQVCKILLSDPNTNAECMLLKKTVIHVAQYNHLVGMHLSTSLESIIFSILRFCLIKL